MYLRLKPSILLQRAKKEQGDQAASATVNSERRRDERRQQEDRRNLTVLRGQARYNRRRHERRDVLMQRDPASGLSIESVARRFDADGPSAQWSAPFCLWIVSGREDLTGQLQNYAENVPVISVLSYKPDQFKEHYEELEDSGSNVILIDTALPEAIVIEQLRAIRRSPSDVKIILLYDNVLPDLVQAIVEFRVSGLLLTGVSQEFFLKAVHAVHKGEYWFPRQLVSRILSFFSGQRNQSTSLQSGDVVFTECEQKVINLLVQGLSNKQIALRLAVSPETVKSHLKAIFAKTGVTNRNRLISLCLTGMRSGRLNLTSSER
ncbi:response regulator transcription factor [Nitrosomonas sp. Is35]|uniref:helix-turn-helix transcriptional regulator n=1 Tax=Nitrosomonas sp. Is35 TaxID=3080534 RepID=UPI00294AC6EB|nr:response regulator transcription factor [Nitrosomonas sp. Is35]MDV6346295.1 response regulator transcription factor [Nitrosomonas sp. Is35]